MVNVVFYEEATAEAYGTRVVGISADETLVFIAGFNEDNIWVVAVGGYVCGCLENKLYQQYEGACTQTRQSTFKDEDIVWHVHDGDVLRVCEQLLSPLLHFHLCLDSPGLP